MKVYVVFADGKLERIFQIKESAKHYIESLITGSAEYSPFRTIEEYDVE